MKKSLLIFLPLSLFISSCSTTGPAEDQWDFERKTDVTLDVKGLIGLPSNEEIAARKQQRAENGGVYYRTSAYSTENLALDEQSFKDFEEFKAWRRAKDEGSIDAQEYREWIEYQQYRAYKSQAEQKNTPSK